MTQQRPRAAGRRGDVPGWGRARVAVAAGLLALAAAGLRVHARPPALDGPFRHDGLVIGVVLETVLACLLVAIAVRHSRAPRDALLAARLRSLLGYVVGLGLIAIPAAYLLSRHVHPRELPRPQRATRPPPPAVPRSGHPGGYPIVGIIVVLIIGTLLAAALIYAIVRLVSMRRGVWAGWRRRAAGLAIEPSNGDDESDLAQAVASGQRALRRLDDARAAIIACYVAMEESLARAGAARGAADTPDELLARAAGQGLGTGGAAARLTALFYEARFSSHPMPPAGRDAAERALRDLAASLGPGSGPEAAVGGRDREGG